MGAVLMRLLLTVIAALLATGCSEPPAPRPKHQAGSRTPDAQMRQFIELQHGAVLHVVDVPTDEWDRARCLVVVTPTGAAAVSCTQSQMVLDQIE